MDKIARITIQVLVALVLLPVWIASATLIRDGGVQAQAKVTPTPTPLDAGTTIVLVVDLPDGAYTVDELQDAATVIERRLEGLALAEFTVQVADQRTILVQVPPDADLDRVIATIQRIGLLEFVDFSGLYGEALMTLVGQSILTEYQMMLQAQRQPVLDPEITPDTDPEATPEPTPELHPNTAQPFTTILTGSALQSVVVEEDSFVMGWLIRFELSPEGGEIFGPFTAGHIGEAVAIVLDGVVLSAPVIQAELTTEGVITGNFSEDEARMLASQLNAGVLPLPLRVETVTPEL